MYKSIKISASIAFGHLSVRLVFYKSNNFLKNIFKIGDGAYGLISEQKENNYINILEHKMNHFIIKLLHSLRSFRDMVFIQINLFCDVDRSKMCMFVRSCTL